MDIESIIGAISRNRVRISDHADEEAEADDLTFDEIYFAVLHGEIIEDYPVDKPYPAALFCGGPLAVTPFTQLGLIMKIMSAQCL